MADNKLIVLYDKEEIEKKTYYYGCIGHALAKNSSEKYFYYTDWLGNDTNPASEAQPVKTFEKCYEIAKNYTGTEKYIHIINLDEVWFSTDESKIIFINTVTGNDSNTGLTLSSPIKTQTKLISLLQSTNRRVIMFLDTAQIDVSSYLNNIPETLDYAEIKVQCRFGLHNVNNFVVKNLSTTQTLNLIKSSAQTLGAVGNAWDYFFDQGTPGYTGYEFNNVYYGIDYSGNNVATHRRRHLLINILTGASAGILDMTSSLVSGQTIIEAVYLSYYNKVVYYLGTPDAVKYADRGSSSLTNLSYNSAEFAVLPHVEKLHPGLPRYHISNSGVVSLINQNFTLTGIGITLSAGNRLAYFDGERLYFMKPTTPNAFDVTVVKLTSFIGGVVEYTFSVGVPVFNPSEDCEISGYQNNIFNLFEENGKLYCEILATSPIYDTKRHYLVFSITENAIVYDNYVGLSSSFSGDVYYLADGLPDFQGKRIVGDIGYAYLYYKPSINSITHHFKTVIDIISYFNGFTCQRQMIDELRHSTFLQYKVVNGTYYFFGYDNMPSWMYFTYQSFAGRNFAFKINQNTINLSKPKSLNYSNLTMLLNSSNFSLGQVLKNVTVSRTANFMLNDINAERLYFNNNNNNIVFTINNSEIDTLYANKVYLNASIVKSAIIENLVQVTGATVLYDSAVIDVKSSLVVAVNSYCQKDVPLFNYIADFKLTTGAIKRLKRKSHNDSDNSPLCFSGSKYFYKVGANGNFYDIGCFVPISEMEEKYNKSFSLIVNYSELSYNIEFPSAEYKGESGALDFYVDSDMIYEVFTITIRGAYSRYRAHFLDLLKTKNKEVEILFDGEESISTVQTTAAAAAGDVTLTLNNAHVGSIYEIDKEQYLGLYLKNANTVVLDSPLHVAVANNTTVKTIKLGSSGKYVFVPEPLTYKRYVSTANTIYDNIIFIFKRKI